MNPFVLLTLAIGLAIAPPVVEDTDTLPSLPADKVPRTVDAAWAGFDPQREPLEVEVLKEWEQDGVVLKVLRYRVGMFKGQKSMMAAVYGYPKDGKNLPGLVQLHGGGQYADWNACLTNAKRGYATISISWGGRISAPDYHVNPGVVKLFWEGQTDHEQYRLTTDWGALDAYHAPNRYAGNSNWSNLKPADWTVDNFVSPRNSNWFLCTLAARRALTFLEQQPEVDGDRLGVYGHSMGGKLAVLVAGIDDRVKAAAPSCGGVSDRNQDELMRGTITDAAYLKRITCPIVFLSPANDFHGRIEDLQTALTEIRSRHWRVTCAAHHQHQDTSEYEVATKLWFDEHLKHSFTWPATPQTKLTLETGDGVPEFTVRPDRAREILAVDVFYTRQGQAEKAPDRFWHFAAPQPDGERWTAKLPLHRVDQPLWVYANVYYRLDEPVSGAGYYYATYTADRFNVSSKMHMIDPAQLAAAGVKSTREASLVIEDFSADWEEEWFSYRKGRGSWERWTRKINDAAYRPPAYAKLGLGVRSDQAGKLIVDAEKHTAEIDLPGGPEWQEIVLFPTDFRDKDGGSRLDWDGVKSLRLAAGTGFGESAEAPFALRGLRWIAGTREELNARRTVRLEEVAPVDGKIYLDIAQADVFTHGHKAVMNKWLDDQPLVIDGQTREHGLTTHAVSEAIYFLGGNYQRFRATALAGPGASVTFQVIVDERKVFDSGLMTAGQARPIDLSVVGAQELKLVVTDGGNGKGGDHASWVEAHLVK